MFSADRVAVSNKKIVGEKGAVEKGAENKSGALNFLRTFNFWSKIEQVKNDEI